MSNIRNWKFNCELNFKDSGHVGNNLVIPPLFLHGRLGEWTEMISHVILQQTFMTAYTLEFELGILKYDERRIYAIREMIIINLGLWYNADSNEISPAVCCVIFSYNLIVSRPLRESIF